MTAAASDDTSKRGASLPNTADLGPFPRPFDQAFIDDCPYLPEAFLLDQLLEIDADGNRVRARMPTSDELPITRHQRVHPIKHPRHVSGGLMVHMTGMIAFVHSYYVLGLKHAEGWIGYGGKIHQARFRALAKPGVPLELECVAKTVRVGKERALCRYDFRFYQGESLVYEGDQTAMWLRVDESYSDSVSDSGA